MRRFCKGISVPEIQSEFFKALSDTEEKADYGFKNVDEEFANVFSNIFEERGYLTFKSLSFSQLIVAEIHFDLLYWFDYYLRRGDC
jgi:hypothetical protein